MSDGNYTLRVPQTDGFELTYYYAKDDEAREPRTFPPHIHDMPEIYLLVEGSACFAVENRLYHLSPGDVIVARPNEMHNCILTEKTVHRHLCFWFSPAPFLLEPILETCEREGNRISPSEEAKETIFRICEELYEASGKQNHRLEYALLCRLLCEIAEGTGGDASDKGTVPDLLARILRDINENFTTIDGIDYFTEKYYLSPSTLGRLFRIHLHTSPGLYLETKKLAHSRNLLRAGKTVTEACTGAGFSDVSGYIRLFRKRFQMTPGEYRKNK